MRFRTKVSRIGVVGLTASFVASSAVRAQSIAERVARVERGIVRLSFAARADVCGNGVYLRVGRTVGDATCERGPVRVALDVVDHEVVRVQRYVGGRWPPGARAHDLGRVPARAAADFLLAVAARASSTPAREAIFPATLADSADVSAALARIADDRSRPEEVRREAANALAQVTGRLLDSAVTAWVGPERVSTRQRAEQPSTGCPGQVSSADLGFTGMHCAGCTLHVGKPVGTQWWEFSSVPSIRGVRRDGPAAGMLRDGDRLLAVNDVRLTSDTGAAEFAAVRPGVPVQVTVVRDGRQISFEVIPGTVCTAHRTIAPPRAGR